MTPSPGRKALRTITLEEHFASPTFMDGPGQVFSQWSHFTPKIIAKLRDMNQQRLADMDAAGIDVQVLSLISPGVEQSEAAEATKLAREANDFLAAAIERHPTRFAGFATLPTPAPDRAADELERTVREYGFKGSLINGHSRGRYLDDKFFWPIFERAEALGVPLYIHPALPTESVAKDLYAGNYSHEVAVRLGGAGWGWHVDTALHVLRIVLSGAFDRYPGLQLIVGHLGEALPFMIPRFDNILHVELTKLNRPVGAYLRENVHYTFSGFNFIPAFLNTLLEVGADRIMFSADYPLGSLEVARSFLERLPVNPAEKEKIAHANAERLLRF
jgi:predicted TIM-barrel fold metal-dependent hydrolase